MYIFVNIKYYYIQSSKLHEQYSSKREKYKFPTICYKKKCLNLNLKKFEDYT